MEINASYIDCTNNDIDKKMDKDIEQFLIECSKVTNNTFKEFRKMRRKSKQKHLYYFNVALFASLAILMLFI